MLLTSQKINSETEDQSQRPVRRKFDSSSDAEVDVQKVEIVEEKTFTSNKACRRPHIQSRIRDTRSGCSLWFVQWEEACQALEMRDFCLASKIYEEILKFHEADSSAKNGFEDSFTVQTCLNLIECYLQLERPKEAEYLLSQLWHPDGAYTIGATHPLFLQTSCLYTRSQVHLKGYSTTEEKGKEINNQEEQNLVISLEVFYMYGYQYVKKGLLEQAAGVYTQGMKYLGQSTKVLDERSKEVAVRIQLALSETFIAMDRLAEASQLLEEVWLPEKPLSIERHHKHFLWLAKIHAHLRNPGVYHPDTAEPPAKHFSLYQRLGVSHTATKEEIRKAYLGWTLWFHPDKGGDTGVMQELLQAYQTLVHEGKRSKYDHSLKGNYMG